MSDMVSPQVMMRRRPPSATPSTSGTTGATTTAATATTITPSPQHPPPLAFRTNVFDGLYRESAEKRAHGLEQATSIVRTWAHHWLEVRDASTSTSALALYSSTTSAVLDEQSVETTAVTTAAVTTTVTAEGTAETTPITPAHRETHNLLQAHILVILRMSINCPYTDVRQRFTDFLAELRAMGISVPRPRLLPYTPSFFIHPERVARLDDLDSVDGNKKKNGREDGNSASEETRRILSNVFVANGRFSNIARCVSVCALCAFS